VTCPHYLYRGGRKSHFHEDAGSGYQLRSQPGGPLRPDFGLMCIFGVCSQIALEGDYTLAPLIYAAPSWWEYTSAKDRARVERLVCRLKRRSFFSAETPDVATLVSEAEDRLFQAIIAAQNHVLRKHLPDIRRSNYNLRPRAHEFTLPLKDDRNFIRLLLFRDI